MRNLTEKSLHERRLPRRAFSESDFELWQKTISEIYARMRRKAETGPYNTVCAGLRITIFPEVYAPRFFTDSCWFASVLPEIINQRSLLEVGTGTGIIAIACARSGAKVVATDINPYAVKNAKINAEQYGLDISVREGDLYVPLNAEEKFDFIFWAHPFNNWNEPVTDMLLMSGRDYHYESLEGYVLGARNHLREGGKLLLGTGDSADVSSIEEIAARHGYRFEILRSARFPLEERGRQLVTYMLCELIRC